MARHSSSFLYLNTVYLPAFWAQDLSQILSCLIDRQRCLAFERDQMARFPCGPTKPENARVRGPLGDTADLARHLILLAPAVPA